MKRFLADWRLLIGFSALIFLIILMGLIGIFQMYSLTGTIDNLGEKYFPMQKAALEMKISNNLYAMGIRNYIFWKNSRYLEAAGAAADLGMIQDVADEFGRQLTIYSSYVQIKFPGLQKGIFKTGQYRQWIEKIEDSARNLHLVGSAIIKLVDEQAGFDAINKSLMIFESRLYKVDNFLDVTLQEFNLRAIREELRKANLRTTQAILFLKWSLVLGVLIGSQTAEIVYRSRKYERKKREQLVQRMITIGEEERKNLSFQVHDQMGQDLSALRIYLDLADKKIFPENKKAKEDIAEIKKILNGLMKKTHNISELLRPPALDEIGLADTISALLFQHKQMAGINFTYQKPRIAVTLPSEYTLLLYRVAQEGLTNIIKHAQAKNVEVVLELKNKVIQLVIYDDGVGFNYRFFSKQPRRRKNDRIKLGLLGLKERVELLGGFMDIKTVSGHGTKLVVELPG